MKRIHGSGSHKPQLRKITPIWKGKRLHAWINREWLKQHANTNRHN
jgi:hypothetical protein